MCGYTGGEESLTATFPQTVQLDFSIPQQGLICHLNELPLYNN